MVFGIKSFKLVVPLTMKESGSPSRNPNLNPGKIN
jgi:hypothetical protein